MDNPFQYSGVVEDAAYLPRAEIEKQLLEYAKSRQNLLVQGPRRVGKTSVVTNTFETLQRKKKCYFLKADFFGVSSLKGVRDILARALEQLPLTAQLRRKLSAQVGKITGMSAFGFGVNWRGTQREQMVEDILAMFAEINQSRPLVVFFDEFQSLLDMPIADEVLGRLRSEIQRQPNVFYIFAGSDRLRLREIFFVENGPFLKSAALLEVGLIERETFIPWLEDRFAEGKRKVDTAVWAPLFDLANDVPGDVQQFCHALWVKSDRGGRIDARLAEDALNYLVNMQESAFLDFWNFLSENQRKLLRGVATMPEEGHTSKGFLERVQLSSSSASSKAMDAMLTRGALWKVGNRFAFSNPVMKLWILRREVF
ncbi:AAA family ATPase [Pelagicoccus mobilis]|nr:ATP-binding protein [Pelagicoccus mobilis]